MALELVPCQGSDAGGGRRSPSLGGEMVGTRFGGRGGPPGDHHVLVLALAFPLVPGGGRGGVGEAMPSPRADATTLGLLPLVYPTNLLLPGEGLSRVLGGPGTGGDWYFVSAP